MAWEIIWSENAKKQRIKILRYWNERNGSNQYAKKLSKMVNDSTTNIAKYPYSGTPTIIQDIRATPVRDYLLLYTIQDSEIIILSFWDTRQDPSKLKI